MENEQPLNLDVESYLAELCEIKEHVTPRGARWSAALDAERAASFQRPNSPLPPGQVTTISYAPAGYLTTSIYDDDPSLRKSPDNWAARPFFYSHESALRMMFKWLRENRPDIVEVCEQEARSARSWRKYHREGAAA